MAWTVSILAIRWKALEQNVWQSSLEVILVHKQNNIVQKRKQRIVVADQVIVLHIYHYGAANFSLAFRQLCKLKQSLNNYILVLMEAT